MPLFGENRPFPANSSADLSIALLRTLPELHRSRRRSACAHQDLDIPSSLPRLRAARRRFVGNFSEESEAGNIVVIVVITVFSAAAAAT